MNTVYQINDIREKLRPVFEAAPIYNAILFGSYASGTATEQSDVDIVVDSRKKLLNIHFYGVLEDITQILGKKVDLIEISEIAPDSPIHNEIRNKGVVLYDRQR